MLRISVKIQIAQQTKISNDLLIIARIESFIFNKGLKDALLRAEMYSKAGADAIMIHSKEKTANEVFKFSKVLSNPNFLNLWLLYQVLTQALLKINLRKMVLVSLFTLTKC